MLGLLGGKVGEPLKYHCLINYIESTFLFYFSFFFPQAILVQSRHSGQTYVFKVRVCLDCCDSAGFSPRRAELSGTHQKIKDVLLDFLSTSKEKALKSRVVQHHSKQALGKAL